MSGKIYLNVIVQQVLSIALLPFLLFVTKPFLPSASTDTNQQWKLMVHHEMKNLEYDFEIIMLFV